MDSTNAQATFIEIAFGVNTLFAVYSHFRDFLRQNVDKKIREYEAEAKTIEPKLEDVTRLNAVKAAVSAYAKQHLKIQHVCVRVATAISVIAAVVCVGVVFWDLIQRLGHQSGWLILPMPAYFAVSGLNYVSFKIRGDWKLHKFRKFIEEFEPGTIPREFR